MRDNVLNNILNLTGGEKFYRFGNSDGKFWVVPARGMRTAMSLYQPSGRKGKMVKSLLPYLHWIAFVRRAIHAETLHCRLNKEIHKLLCEIFNTNEIDFAIFEGTPSVHKKITMQLSCGKQVLGYCKLSCNEEIGKLFEKETDILRRLAEREITNIPEALCCTTLDKDCTYSFKAPRKPHHRRYPTGGTTSTKSSLNTFTKRQRDLFYLKKATITARLHSSRNTSIGCPTTLTLQ